MLRLLLLTTLLSTVLSCVVKPPDIFACKRLEPVRGMPSPRCMSTIGEPSCGYCTYTIRDESFLVGNKPENLHSGRSWNEYLDRSVILPVKESYGPLKEYIVNSCKAANCDAVISNWRVKLDTLDVE